MKVLSRILFATVFSKSKITCIFVFVFSSTFASAQKQLNIQFGKISSSEFDLRNNTIIDSNSNAVIIADLGSTSFIGNKKGGFTLVFKRHTRIKILNEKAFDLATIRIRLYSRNNDLEKLIDLNAYTYNLENGKLIDTKLDKKDVFEEKIDKNRIEKKFTMPAIKAGSIIEYTYTINSDHIFSPRPWEFQHINYPCLWSEYGMTVPNLLIYAAANQGVHPFYINELKRGEQHYSVTKQSGSYYGDQNQDLSIIAVTNIYRYVMKDIPGFQIQSYLTTPDNYLDKIEFQLAKHSGDGQTYTEVFNNWKKTSDDLLQNDNFGSFLQEDNSFADKELGNITNNLSDKLLVAKKIYNYIKDNFTCTEDGNFLMTNSLKNVFRKRTGNVTDINLLLIAMLVRRGISCEPILLSTRDHGLNYFKYPILSKFNYVLCKANIDNNTYYLDATHPRLGFGKLDPRCYNGKARIINGLAEEVTFNADSLHENKTIFVQVKNDAQGTLRGSVQKVLGYDESYQLRKKISEVGEIEFLKDLKKSVGTDLEISDITVASLKNFEESVTIKYDFTFNPDKKDIFYVNPVLEEGFKVNPFKSQERYYPVEMPYTRDETYLFTMEVPDGYMVDELPKQLAVKLNERGDGRFEYLVSQSGNIISVKYQVRLNRTVYLPQEYDQLREFFNLVIKKQSEQIIFKKKE